MSPLSDEAHKLYRNAPAMLFANHALRDVEYRRFEELGEMLGTTWTRERAMALNAPEKYEKGKSREPRQRLMIPLLIGMNAKMVEFIGKSFGNPDGINAPEWYRQDRGEVVEGYDMPKSAFKKLASMFTSLIKK